MSEYDLLHFFILLLFIGTLISFGWIITLGQKVKVLVSENQTRKNEIDELRANVLK